MRSAPDCLREYDVIQCREERSPTVHAAVLDGLAHAEIDLHVVALFLLNVPSTEATIGCTGSAPSGAVNDTIRLKFPVAPIDPSHGSQIHDRTRSGRTLQLAGSRAKVAIGDEVGVIACDCRIDARHCRRCSTRCGHEE